MEPFIQSLKEFVDLEYDTDNEATKEIWRHSLVERTEMGEALSNLTLKVHANCTTATLTCPVNLSKFRKGSRVRLHRGNPFDPYSSYACEILEDDGTVLKIEAGYRVHFSNLENGGGYILDNDLIDIRHIQKGALDKMLYAPKGKKIYKILQGAKVPSFDKDKRNQALLLADSLNMNDKQKEAFSNAYSTDSHYLIQGPPGTGKTWVLAYLAAELAKQGEKVLITAFTHRAINNALKKIKQVTNFENIAKIGQLTRSDDLEWEDGKVRNYERLKNSPYHNRSRGLILGGTCFAVCTSRLQEMDFDTVIFDEAGQVPLPLGIAGMLSGKKYILIGDHLQMAPIIKAEHSKQELTKSVFEYLFNGTPDTMLNITYRMNSAINSFPSAEFYNNDLIPFEANASRKLTYTTPLTKFSSLLSAEKPSVFLDLKHRGRTVRSKEEATYIAVLIYELIQAGISKNEIAVIAPYRAQGRLIRKTIRDKFKEKDAAILDSILIDTVERIQGQERDVVIISLTTSDLAHAAQRADFFFKPNRLNVALTRSRLKRIVVGSSVLFETKTKDPQFNAWIRVFQRFYDSCTTFVQ